LSNATAILFVGGIGGSPAADIVAGCHSAIVRDTIEHVKQSGAFDRVILVTERDEQIPSITTELSRKPFHFGRQLREIIYKYDIRVPFYIGGGSTPLLTTKKLKALGERISSASHTAITNNPFSADLVAFNPGQAIDNIELYPTDNRLSQLLVEQAGLHQIALPKRACYQFDVDTPADLYILKLHPGTGRHTRKYLESLKLDTSRLEEAMRMFNDINAQVTIAGRVGSHVWSQLEKKTSCRVRMLAEERSMIADERSRRSEVCTILGFYLEQVGMERFFQTLANLGHAAFIDTRVLFTHFVHDSTTEDRFYSDMGQYQQIMNPFIREFTQRAAEAPIPVILGGHSLVSGGMLALIEAGRKIQRGGG
jgi:hypothetical protein